MSLPWIVQGVNFLLCAVVCLACFCVFRSCEVFTTRREISLFAFADNCEFSVCLLYLSLFSWVFYLDSKIQTDDDDTFFRLFQYLFNARFFGGSETTAPGMEISRKFSITLRTVGVRMATRSHGISVGATGIFENI